MQKSFQTLALTRGSKVTLALKNTKKRVTFVAGGQKRVELYPSEPGWVMVNGQIRFADQSHYWAILVICEKECAELWDWGVFLEGGGIVFASDYLDSLGGCGVWACEPLPVNEAEREYRQKIESEPHGPIDEFFALLGKTREEIWPFSYRYDVPLNAPFDPHIDSSGWSTIDYNKLVEAAAHRLPIAAEIYHVLQEIVSSDGVERGETIAEAKDVPQWDAERRELLFRGQIVKKYRQPAKNQVAIIEGFQVAGWPTRIDDPLPYTRNGDARQRLADAVLALNKNVAILFELDGRQGVVWQAKPL